MEQQPINKISISDLLNHRRPISGTSSLSTTSTTTTFSTTTINPNLSPNSKTLISLPHPSIIIGVLSLPDPLSFTPRSCHSCFSFSDNDNYNNDDCSICCDVVDFDFRMIGRKIHLLAWNFIPSNNNNKHFCGVLEIVRWKFADGFDSSDDWFPFTSDFLYNDGCRKDQRRVFGVLECVSPISLIPSHANRDDDSCGFLAKVLCCECMLCKSKDFDRLVKCNEKHCFSQTGFVFFRGNTLCWFPALLKCIGNVMSFSGLRKKVVYIGEDEEQLMLVSTNLTRLCCLKLEDKGSYGRNLRDDFERKDEFGTYVGVVKSIYMQGMLVRLDKEVWLVLTNQLCSLPHSVRVGAVLCVRNVHILKPKFRWSKMLILGACYRSNISVVSFSPLKTGCQMLSHSQSLLRRFIDSLDFPARLWVLLVVQCFRKKLSGIFSDKEILGSKHTEGLVEKYAKSMFPSSVFHSHCNMFMEFCKHISCRSHGSRSYDGLSLAVPFYNFVSNCAGMWIISLLQMKVGLRIMEDCSQTDNLFKEKSLSDQPIRRIWSSKEIGVSLLGNLKISLATGRLQIVDTTGSIDAVVPDLPSAWSMEAIYEVINYSLVLEGTASLSGEEWVIGSELFSCGDIFHSIKEDRKTNMEIFVHFIWRDVVLRDFPALGCPNYKDNPSDLESGAYHLLYLAHKFPVPSQFNSDMPSSEKCFLFAEAMVLPCDLIIGASDDAALPSGFDHHGLQSSCQSNFSFKKCKSSLTSNCCGKVVLCDNSRKFTERSCSQSSNSLSLPFKRSVDHLSVPLSVQIPCTVTVRRVSGRNDVSGILCFTQDDRNCDFPHLRSPRTVFLEFNSENLLKYKSLQIGGYYIIKHCAQKCFCDSDNTASGSKVIINLEMHLLSLSFNFNEALLGSYVSKSSCSCHLENELLFHHCSIAKDHLNFYDVSLNVTGDGIDFPDVDLQALVAAILNPYTRPREICSINEPVGCRNTIVNPFQTSGMRSGNHLPQGNLISLSGIVESIHSGCCSTTSDLRFTNNRKHLLCLHVLTDGQMVQIDGHLSEHNYPIGLGPGANVTFHRILASGQDNLRIMPVSVITVNTVGEVPPPSAYSFFSVPEDSVASGLISGLVHYDASKPRRFVCKVVAVHIVMLERNKKFDKLMSDIHSAKWIVNVPLAGFVLDDGSSLCCCWANGARAETFLRLHEEMPQVGVGSSWLRSDGIGFGKACSTPSSYLDKILKRHGRVTVKNFGSINESFGQDLQLSVSSDIILGIQDENLLKFVILNACSSIPWCVVGHVMDPSAINELQKHLLKEQMNMPAIENVWATDVCHVNTLAEARTLYQDLL